MKFYVFNKKQSFLRQTAQFDRNINLFCLVFPTFEFSLAVFFLQLAKKLFSLLLYYILHFTHTFDLSSHYILLTHYLLKQIRHN